MSTQQDIYAVGSENRPSMLNKDNYVPWSSRIIRYARTKPNGNMIVDSIENGPYVRRMIATTGELDPPIPVLESFHEQTDEELTENDIKRMDADDQAIQTILLGHPEDVYVVVDSSILSINSPFLLLCDCDIPIPSPLALMAHSQNSYNFLATHNDQSSSSTHSQQLFPINNKYNPQPSLNQNSMQPPMTFLKDNNDPTEAMNAALILFAKNGLVVVPGISNQNGTGNIVAARAEGTGNKNQARTMATTIEQQVTLDEALVPSTQRAFLVTADVPEIYMQEFWATATVQQHSIRFKMETRKHIVDLEAFREMLHISPRVPGQSFAELPFKEEILEFLRFLRHSAQIKTLTDKPSIPRQNRVNWHYVKDDILFSTIKVVSRHQNTQQYGVILPIELTTEDIRNTKAYKEYYACATGEAAPKPKASARKKKEAEQLKIILKRSRHKTHISQQGGSSTDEGISSIPGVPDVPSDDSKEEISWNSSDDEDKEESFDPIPRTPEDGEDDGNGEEDEGLRISEEERMHEEEEAYELYRDVDINQGRGLQVSQDIEDSHVTLTPTHSDGQQESLSTSSFVTNLLNLIIDPGAVSNIPGLVHQYMHQKLTKAVREAVQTQTDRLQDSTQRENDEFLRTINDNMKKIIKERVKSQVKAQVTRIFPRIEESVNAQLKTEVLTRSSYSSRTSYAVAADLSEMELKKILIDKMEGNKSIQRSDEQQNLYKALIKAYDADKTILDTYEESAILKRRREEDDDQEGPFAGSDRGSKRRREEGEHASAALHLNQLPRVQAGLL
nr:hypothetical protein [Tanacetum cinerariifolium]